ncbi:DUF1289 domain-containing protein [Methylocystis silviterrae]|uniref:DUF1289 domain-containing protein n=1 Tax=Methylocystis silviterrae TaxID=2743612 RepID=UPI001E5AF1D5|nr:DUF1289 domain-containing protein [Methylocystis silviterrae]
MSRRTSGVFDARGAPSYSAAGRIRRNPGAAQSKVEPMVDSPCIKICELDQDGVCVGCGRTRAEIAGWMSMSDAEKAQVVERADKRKRAMSASDKSKPQPLIASSE